MEGVKLRREGLSPSKAKGKEGNVEIEKEDYRFHSFANGWYCLLTVI